MKLLLERYKEFRQSVLSANRQFYENLVLGQEPDTMLITCSDSRICPESMFGYKPGEVFVLRNAGNIVPSYGGGASGGEVATIEYAVAVLKVKHIVVCGHTGCGAMKALLDPDSVSSLPGVAEWLRSAENTRRVVMDSNLKADPAELVSVASRENALCQLDNLRTHPAVASAVRQGKLQLHAWVYKLEDHVVEAYNPETHRFEPVMADERVSV
ncbi:carbonic anhydrase [bacterium]|nr:carbonic anhydrase [bacterium]